MSKLLLVSVHKSGTNMLTQAIGGSYDQINGRIEKDDIHPHPKIISRLEKFKRFGRCHLSYHPKYSKLIRRLGGKIIFLYRDPRDCIVSWAHYVDEVKGHTGFINFEVGNNQKLEHLSISKRIDAILHNAKFEYKRYAKWIDTPDDLVHKIRYEDILLETIETFQKFLDWIGRDLITMLSVESECSTPQDMIERIDPETCETFRRGIIGEWKNYFTVEQEEKFWLEMEDVMNKMGYEGNY